MKPRPIARPTVVPVSPLLAGLSKQKLRAHRNNRKIAQGYDANPPRCGNCSRFVPSSLVVVDLKGGKEWTAPYCGLGSFAVDSQSVCDMWRGMNGETLE